MRVSHPLCPHLATSNAPNTRRKRRISSVEREDADEDPVSKKTRAESTSSSLADALSSPVTEQQPVTAAVKEVTDGVKEVDLEDKPGVDSPAAPEAVPLPEEKEGELDDPPSDGLNGDKSDDSPLDGTPALGDGKEEDQERSEKPDESADPPAADDSAPAPPSRDEHAEGQHDTKEASEAKETLVKE